MKRSVAALERWEVLLAGVLVATVVVGAVISVDFLVASNLSLALDNAVPVGMMALPEALIIITAQIDLSVAATLALAATLLGTMVSHGTPIGVAIVVTLIAGLVAGLVNGLFIAVFRVPSLLVTLGTLSLYRGIAEVILGQGSISTFPNWFSSFGLGTVPGTGQWVPWTLIPFAVLAVAFGFVLHRSTLGRRIYAVGSNPVAARYAGVRVARITIALFGISGLVAALAGVIDTAYLSSARSDIALGQELDVVTVALLGGVAIFGGRGSLPGVVLAWLVLAVLDNILALKNVSGEGQQISTGALLILSVLAARGVSTAIRHRRLPASGIQGAPPGDAVTPQLAGDRRA